MAEQNIKKYTKTRMAQELSITRRTLDKRLEKIGKTGERIDRGNYTTIFGLLSTRMFEVNKKTAFDTRYSLPPCDDKSPTKKIMTQNLIDKYNFYEATLRLLEVEVDVVRADNPDNPFASMKLAEEHRKTLALCLRIVAAITELLEESIEKKPEEFSIEDMI